MVPADVLGLRTSTQGTCIFLWPAGHWEIQTDLDTLRPEATSKAMS